LHLDLSLLEAEGENAWMINFFLKLLAAAHGVGQDFFVRVFPKYCRS